MPDAGAATPFNAAPVLAPDVEVGIVPVLGESLQLLERSPVLHDRRNAHLVREQTLLWMGDQLIEHVLHPASAAQIQQPAGELQLVVEPRADEKDNEIAVDLGRHPPTSYFADEHHPQSPACRRSYLSSAAHR